jgi:hypothetical protein
MAAYNATLSHLEEPLTNEGHRPLTVRITRVRNVETSRPWIAKGGIVQAQFEIIQPLANDDGRVQRVLGTWILPRSTSIVTPPPDPADLDLEVIGNERDPLAPILEVIFLQRFHRNLK